MPDLQSLLPFLPESWREAVISLAAFVGIARLFIKPIAAWLRALIVRAMETASNSIDPVDDTWIEALVNSRGYKIASYLIRYFATIELPVAAELHQPRSQNSTIAP